MAGERVSRATAWGVMDAILNKDNCKKGLPFLGIPKAVVSACPSSHFTVDNHMQIPIRKVVMYLSMPYPKICRDGCVRHCGKKKYSCRYRISTGLFLIRRTCGLFMKQLTDWKFPAKK